MQLINNFNYVKLTDTENNNIASILDFIGIMPAPNKWNAVISNTVMPKTLFLMLNTISYA